MDGNWNKRKGRKKRLCLMMDCWKRYILRERADARDRHESQPLYDRSGIHIPFDLL